MLHRIVWNLNRFTCILLVLSSSAHSVISSYTSMTSNSTSNIPEFAMLPYCLRLFATISHNLHASHHYQSNHTNIDRMSNLYESLVNASSNESFKDEDLIQSTSESSSSKQKPLESDGSRNAGSQLKLTNDRIILLLVFNNLLLDLIANLEDNQKQLKDKLLHKMIASTVVKTSNSGKPPAASSMVGSTSDHMEMLQPMASNPSTSTSSSFDSSKVGADALLAMPKTKNRKISSLLKTASKTSTTEKASTEVSALNRPQALKQLMMMMKGDGDGVESAESRKYSQMTKFMAENTDNSTMMAKAAPNERVIYITDHNQLIGPELRGYIEDMANQKKLQVVFKGKGTGIEKQTENRSIPDSVPEKILDNAIDHQPMEADWKPIYPYRMTNRVAPHSSKHQSYESSQLESNV